MAGRLRRRHRRHPRRPDRRPGRDLVDRRCDRARLRLPLGPRRDHGAARAAGRRRARDARAARGRRRGPGRARADRGALPAQPLPRGRHARPRRRDRRPRHRAGRRLRAPAAVPRPEAPRGRPRPAHRLPRGEVVHRHLHDRPQGGRGLAAHGVRPQQRPRQERAELHDHLEPLRASRLPGAGERPDRRDPRREERRRAHGQRADPPQARRARRLRLPLPRRPVRHRGQPHRRPARACARPLLVRDQERAPDPAQHLLGLARRRHRRAGEDLQVQASRSRASTSTGPSSGSIPSSRRTTDGAEATAHEGRAPPRADAGRRHVPGRLARGAVRARRRHHATSSSATCPATSTGCRRSARRR